MSRVVDASNPERRPERRPERKPEAAAARQAVRTAEQTVSDAWIGQVLLAECETEAVLGACTRVREQAAGRVRAAQRAGNLADLVRSQCDLELAEAARRRAVDAHERARIRLVHEVSAWSEGIARRVRQARADRPNAGW